MLPLDYILKVGRLLDQTGESRPGFLHDEKANLEGNGSGAESCPLVVCEGRPAGAQKEREKTVTVLLEYSEDSTTGDVRIVQK
jgi:hypothetical protein